MFTFSLGDLEEGSSQETKEYAYRDWEDIYRKSWKWDKVVTASHCVDCYPTNCPYRAYVKDGIVWYGEQRGTLPVIEQGVPDMNPMGCQKGAGWSHMIYSQERVLYPLKRVGERGEGKWQRISWDQALTEIADAVIDVLQEVGPEAIFNLTGCNGGGGAGGGIMAVTGGISTDLNAEMNDFSPGHYITFGTFDPVSSIDDWFHAELSIIWFSNPSYTRIPHHHYVLETRYHGGEVVTIAPDFSPSSIHADYYVPVKVGTDAALCLGMCQVIVDEGLYNAGFVKDQTDLPLLVRLDNRRFLRASDVVEDGRDDQFYFYDSKTNSVVEAPRGTLALGDIDPALEGVYRANLKDGRQVDVTPVFELLKERLAEYTPEKASQMCGVHPDTIRTLARKVATKTTNVLTGLNNAGKHYHGDLMERAMLLLLGLTGNWGKKGTGVRTWMAGMIDGGMVLAAAKQRGMNNPLDMLKAMVRARDAIKAEDPTMTDTIAAIEMAKRASAAGQARATGALGMRTVPPVFLWYYHAGYKDVWNHHEWHDPSMVREFDDYFNEAVSKGWWQGVNVPGPDQTPRLLIQAGANALRRTPGGQMTLLKYLWPKLKLIVTLDYRMSTTAHFSDIFLPVATQYEKIAFGIPTTHVLNFTLGDKVVDPPGEAKTEIEIARIFAEKLRQRSQERGITEVTDPLGRVHRIEDMYNNAALFEDEESRMDDIIRGSAIAGTLPEGTTLETVREKGFVRFTGLGISPRAMAQASDIKPDETFNPFRNHTEKKEPYPTLTRRAQFYIDHEWFLEAGEELPVHKDPPKMGGDYPFTMTSGHNRWSIHSLNIINRLMLETHRGRPHMVMNPADAWQRGIRDNEEVRVYNDAGAFIVPVKLSPSVRPGQVICYNGWEPYMFKGQRGPNDLEVGMVKWLHFAGGYGHLKYWPMQWQPAPAMRGTRVEVAKID